MIAVGPTVGHLVMAVCPTVGHLVIAVIPTVGHLVIAVGPTVGHLVIAVGPTVGHLVIAVGPAPDLIEKERGAIKRLTSCSSGNNFPSVQRAVCDVTPKLR